MQRINSTLEAANDLSSVISGTNLLGGTYVGAGKVAGVHMVPSSTDLNYDIRLQMCVDKESVNDGHDSSMWQDAATYTQDEDTTDAVRLPQNAWYRFRCVSIDAGGSVICSLVT